MFRSPQPGDWAAEDEDTSPLPTPSSAPSVPDPVPPAPAPRQDTRYDRSSSEITEEDVSIGTGITEEDVLTAEVDDMIVITTEVDVMTGITTEMDALIATEDAMKDELMLPDGDTMTVVEDGTCLDGDLFFHISEAPVDVQLQDEVEFRVKYNQRSDKEMACQLVALPKGTIKVEEVEEKVYE
ncbi:hypothetical protein PHPALM_29151, partial [Phytophthora palmivora]